jgi:hypothetical protein
MPPRATLEGVAEASRFSTTNAVLNASLEWDTAGFSQVPILGDGSKGAAAPWKEFQSRRPTREELIDWHGRGKSWGIGIPHGPVSGNSLALDFEEESAEAEWLALCDDHGFGALARSLPLIETPSGGRHRLLRCEGGEPVGGNKKLAHRLIPAGPDAVYQNGGRSVIIGGKTMPVVTVKGEQYAKCILIETRGEGGYTVAPGSPAACHPANRPYRFLSGSPSTVPVITAEELSALLSFARLLDEAPVEVYREPAAPRLERDTSGGKRPGDDFSERGDPLPYLEASGWRVVGSRGETTTLCRPGKSRGISATWNANGSRYFYVFSSNGAPFEPERGYSAFAVVAILDHNGDFAEAARRLGAEGWGDQTPLPSPARRDEWRDRHARESIGAAIERVPAMPPTSAPSSGDVPWPAKMEEEAYYGLVGDVVRTITPHTESDPHAILVQLLTAFGSVCGRNPYFLVESDRHHTNLFSLIVGTSGKGRKGTSWSNVKNLFSEVAPEWAAERVKSGLSSGEGLIHAVRDDGGDGFDSVEDKRLLVIEAEFASLLKVMQRDGNTISARIRAAWESGELETLTRKNPARASGAHISIVGHITNLELTRLLTASELANGFINRYLFVCAKRNGYLPDGGNFMEDPARPALVHRLQGAVEFASTVGRVKRDDEARRLWHDLYPQLSEGEPGMYGAATSRAEAQVTRLSLLYALLDHSDVIRTEHLTAALAAWEYCAASAKFIFGDALGDPEADHVLRLLREAGTSGLTRTALTNAMGRNRKAEDIQRALDLLASTGRARHMKVSNGGPGRDTEVWFAA